MLNHNDGICIKFIIALQHKSFVMMMNMQVNYKKNNLHEKQAFKTHLLASYEDFIQYKVNTSKVSHPLLCYANAFDE
jgi:hypothetical protein